MLPELEIHTQIMSYLKKKFGSRMIKHKYTEPQEREKQKAGPIKYPVTTLLFNEHKKKHVLARVSPSCPHPPRISNDSPPTNDLFMYL